MVTPVWNRHFLTAQMLRDLHMFLGKTDEVIIVDNGSTDETPNTLKTFQGYFGERLRVLRNETNLGFGAGNNRGAKVARGRIIVFMSNDVRLHAGPFAMVEHLLDEDPKQMLCGRVVDWQAGWNQFGELVIPYAEGWFLAVQRSFLDDVGLFDEQFSPCDYEDMDLSYRATKAGYRLRSITPQARLEHVHGATGVLLGNRMEITQRNRLLFAQKWGLSVDTASSV